MFLFLLLFGCIAEAQVKVGANPTSIENGVLLQLDKEGTRGGLLIPRVALNSTSDATTITMNTNTAGTLIYNTATAGSGFATVSPGFYLWNGSAWLRIATRRNNDADNIFTTDGYLQSDRVVWMDQRRLVFQPFNTQLVNQFSVDDNTFSVDALNNRVGIGTTLPTGKLSILHTDYEVFSITRGHTSTSNATGLEIRKTLNADPSINTALTNDAVIGQINFRAANGSSYGQNATINAFAVGNQSNTNSGGKLEFQTVTNGSTTLNTRMTIADNGNVGIGTTAPSSPLHIFSPTPNIYLFQSGTSSNRASVVMGRGTNYWSIGTDINVNNGNNFFIWQASVPATRLIIDNNGNVGIGVGTPTNILHINGQGRATSPTFATTSDMRLKENISDYKLGINELMKIHTVEYNYKSGVENMSIQEQSKRRVGILAQEIEKILPNTISKIQENGLNDQRVFSADELIYLLINSVQQQQLIIDKQDQMIIKLEERIKQIESK